LSPNSTRITTTSTARWPSDSSRRSRKRSDSRRRFHGRPVATISGRCSRNSSNHCLVI
jgi:hypothetical protein